jgi:isopentenyl phosphate kinase
VFFLSDVDGLYAARPGSDAGEVSRVLATFSAHDARSLWRSSRDTQDVSGGMSRKAAYALDAARHCERCVIASGIEAGVLEKLLRGESGTGTLVTRGDAADEEVPNKNGAKESE